MCSITTHCSCLNCHFQNFHMLRECERLSVECLCVFMLCPCDVACVCLSCPSDAFEFVRCLSPKLRTICHRWDSLYMSLTPRSWAVWSPLTPCDSLSTFIMSLQPPCHNSNSLTVWVTPLSGTPISHLEACLSVSLSLCVCLCVCMLSLCLYELLFGLCFLFVCFYYFWINQCAISQHLDKFVGQFSLVPCN